ncbi:MAG TPA: hypothetical protein VK468_09925 [Pyrinomonadaceae bacterium]|nr:hypothetical protein [Pyrinomonadaceae bacterium]
MNFQSFSKSAAAFAVAIAAFSGANAQSKTRVAPVPTERPASEAPIRDLPVAERNNLYCAGYVQKGPIDTSRKIVGAVDEQDGFLYSQNNFMYINAGANKGVQVGDMMSVVRPRGQVKTRWTNKGRLGFYVQEVGAVEVVAVKAEVSAVRVRTSCDNIVLGDLVQPSQVRVSPMHAQRPAIDLFRDPSGKAMGRLFMARDNVDLIGKENIVYIDLGAEDNVQVGDYLTIFRPLGKGNLFISDEDESVSARDEGFQSIKYRGGRFSNQAARKSGETAKGRVVTTEKAKENRPSNIRKVVGEMVILNVKERTATAVITRTAQEIHPGDWVEVQ